MLVLPLLGALLVALVNAEFFDAANTEGCNSFLEMINACGAEMFVESLICCTGRIFCRNNGD